MPHQFIVQDLKIRLDKFLVSQTKEFSRGQIQKAIEQGLVSVNKVVQNETDYIVRVGDMVNFEPVKNLEVLSKNIPLTTLYNDHGLLIIDKPPGISVHPGAGVVGDSLTQALLYHFKDIYLVGEEHRPGIVHRLDKDTSGVMLIALTQEMYEYLKDAFAQRLVKKKYIALVSGTLPKPQGYWDLPLGKSRADFRKMTTKNPKESKDSLTEFKVLESLHSSSSGEFTSQSEKLRKGEAGAKATLKGLLVNPSGLTPDGANPGKPGRVSLSKGHVDNWSLIQLKLHTGRTHQIRVHASESGHPLAGDKLYGGKSLPGLDRQFLHAASIEVQLPDKTWIEAESSLPNDLRKVLQDLGYKKLDEL